MNKHLVCIFAALSLGTAACNDSKLAAAAIASPEPTATATPAPANEPPVAQIAGATSYAPLGTASFDGGNSYDPDGTIASYAWAIVARPAGSASTIQQGGTPAVANFFVDLAGDYTIELTVTDNQGATGSQQLNFSAVPSQDLHIELTWSASYTLADMDLHLINKTQTPASGNFWNSTYDCFFSNCKPPYSSVNWWTAATNDNPTLDIDNINETVPENINVAQPHDGAYEVAVHFYSHDVPLAPVTVTVNIYVGGVVAWSGQRTLTATKQEWRAATINWSNGTATIAPFSQTNNADIVMTTYGS